jgi:hypothetical protein
VGAPRVASVKNSCLMMHLPSLAVGSLCSVVSFLLIHRDLSHRSRISKKWELAELVESEFKRALDSIRTSSVHKLPSNLPTGDRVIDVWNNGVNKVRGEIEDLVFGKGKR